MSPATSGKRSSVFFLVYALPPPFQIQRFNISTGCGEADYTWSEHLKSRQENTVRISDRIRTLYSQSDFRGKNKLFGLFFTKHNLHIILPLNIQKNQRNVNFKGLKLALKNLVRFSSPTASGAILRGKYQHFGLSLIFKTSRSHNSVYNYKKNLRNLNFKGSNLTREAKNPIFIAIIF